METNWELVVLCVDPMKKDCPYFKLGEDSTYFCKHFYSGPGYEEVSYFCGHPTVFKMALEKENE